MKRREIGRSGIVTSAIALGTWAMGGDGSWGNSDEPDAIKTIFSALDSGIDLIDTAPAYGFGQSERILGTALNGLRQNVKLITKCGLRFDGVGSLMKKRDGGTVSIDLSREAIILGLEQSLKNLKTDYIDILISHWQSVPPCLTPISETMDAMLELKKAGKIRSIGISNVTMDQIHEYMKYGHVDIVQMKYSMLTRDVEDNILPYCESNGITLQAYSPLEQGLLTGNITKDQIFSDVDIRNVTHWYQPELRSRVIDVIKGWSHLCEKFKCSLSNLAIAWLLAQGDLINVICGARKPGHILENVDGGNLVLDLKTIEKMREDIESIG